MRLLDRWPRAKVFLAQVVRGVLLKVFDPGMVTTERVVEYPFVFQNLETVRGPVLDIGCVGSRFPVALASRGFRVVGIDYNAYPYRHPNLRAVRGDAMHLPFSSGCFGVVLAVSVLEHIGIGHYGDPLVAPGDRGAILEMVRVLRPAGRAIITVPFGHVRTDGFQRVYDASRLRDLLAPLAVLHIEYAHSSKGLWMPCAEAEAAAVDWTGPTRAVAMIVATRAS